jgi:hypothetical protein
LTGTAFGGGGTPSSLPIWGGENTTAPLISNIMTCYDGVTDTTADICWTTNELATSQVQFWASPIQLSPIDMRFVSQHHVHLTGLTPNTTYYYQAISRDVSGNWAISQVYSFTTLPEASASFVSSNLSISPATVAAREPVHISVLVTNTGNAAGNYELTLKINDAVEATEEITLDAGASQSVSFTVRREAAGSYSVAVDNLTGSFTVRRGAASNSTVTDPAASQPTPSPYGAASTEGEASVNWPLVGGIIAGVVVIIVGLLTFFVVRRRAA